MKKEKYVAYVGTYTHENLSLIHIFSEKIDELMQKAIDTVEVIHIEA